MKVSSVGPTYARCPLLSELALPGLSRRHVAAVWHPVKRRALIGSRDAQDHQAPPGEDNRSTPATTINDCTPQPSSSSLSPDRRASTMRDASLRRRRPRRGVASLTRRRGPSRRAQPQRRWRRQRFLASARPPSGSRSPRCGESRGLRGVRAHCLRRKARWAGPIELKPDLRRQRGDTQRQRVVEVDHHRQANDLGRRLEVAEYAGIAHAREALYCYEASTNLSLEVTLPPRPNPV